MYLDSTHQPGKERIFILFKNNVLHSNLEFSDIVVEQIKEKDIIIESVKKKSDDDAHDNINKDDDNQIEWNQCMKFLNENPDLKFNAMHYFARAGDEKNLNIVNAQCCNDNKLLINQPDRDGRTPLYWAKSKECINFLLKNGADPFHEISNAWHTR